LSQTQKCLFPIPNRAGKLAPHFVDLPCDVTEATLTVIVGLAIPERGAHLPGLLTLSKEVDHSHEEKPRFAN